MLAAASGTIVGEKRVTLYRVFPTQLHPSTPLGWTKVPGMNLGFVDPFVENVHCIAVNAMPMPAGR